MRKAWFIALKEWKEILRDFYVLGILVFLPLAMVGTLVVLIYFYMSFFLQNLDQIQIMLSSMPKAYLEGLSGYTDIQKVAILPIKIIGLPFFLLIPLLMSGIITLTALQVSGNGTRWRRCSPRQPATGNYCSARSSPLLCRHCS